MFSATSRVLFSRLSTSSRLISSPLHSSLPISRLPSRIPYQFVTMSTGLDIVHTAGAAQRKCFPFSPTTCHCLRRSGIQFPGILVPERKDTLQEITPTITILGEPKLTAIEPNYSRRPLRKRNPNPAAIHTFPSSPHQPPIPPQQQ